MLGFLKKAQLVEKNVGSSELLMEALPFYFVNSQLEGEVYSIVDDILECYIFKNYGLDNVYEVKEKNFRKSSLTIRNILLKAFLGQEQTISKIKLSNDLASVELFVSKQVREDGTLDFGEFKNIQPEKTVIFEKIFSDDQVRLLKQCFEMLWNVYQREKRQNKLNEKLIFKKYGFNALFIEPRNPEESYVCQQNCSLLRESVQSIFRGNGGIIDANDSIGFVASGDKGSINFLEQIDTIYSEIARLLKVSLTRLLGRSPQGMNATGESDSLNYDLTLDRYRSKWLEPFLNAMRIEYEKVAKIDFSYLKEIIEMQILCGMEPDEELKNKLNVMSKNL